MNEHPTADDGSGGRPLLSSRHLHEHLTILAVRSARRLGPSRACSITAVDRTGAHRVASSDEASAACDAAEVAAGSGPCLDAAREQQVVVVRDVATATRWPAWSATAVASGFRSAAAFPAFPRGPVAASLNVYSTTLDPWDTRMIVECDAYAQMVGAMLDLCAAVPEPDGRRDALHEALIDQVAVDRATGAVMYQRGCDRAEALLVLETAARDGGVTLAQVARAVLDGVLDQ